MRTTVPGVLYAIVMVVFLSCFFAADYLGNQYMQHGATTPTAEQPVWSKGYGYGVRYIREDQDRTLKTLRFLQFGIVLMGAAADALGRWLSKRIEGRSDV